MKSVWLEQDITRLLRRWGRGDDEAREAVVEHLYPQLRRLVGHHLRRGRRPSPIQTTELIHELYLSLDDQQRVVWRDRAHFFAVAGRLLRRIIVDHERHRSRYKRGGGQAHLPIEEAFTVSSGSSGEIVDVVALGRALARLESIDSEAAQVVDLRYFAGLSHDEAAEALGIGRATVTRRWRFARAWLRQQLDSSGVPFADPLAEAAR